MNVSERDSDGARERGGRGPPCLDSDTLVDLHHLLSPDPEGALAHLRSCARCGATLRVPALVREACGAVEEAGEGEEALAERVLRRLPMPPGEGPRARPPGTAPGRWIGVAASVGSAALAGFFGALVVRSGLPGSVSPSAALLAGALTGLVPLLQDGPWRRGLAGA